MANIEDSPHDYLLEDDPSDSQEHASGTQEGHRQEEHRDEGPSRTAPPVTQTGATRQTFEAQDIMSIFRGMMKDQTDALRREF